MYLQILRGPRHWKHKLHSPAELISCCSVIALGKLEREGSEITIVCIREQGRFCFVLTVSQLCDNTLAEFGVGFKALTFRLKRLLICYFVTVGGIFYAAGSVL